MGIFSSVGEFLFGSDPDYDQAQDYQTQYLSQATETLSPYTTLGDSSSTQLMDLLMGNYNIEDLSGYEAMTENVSSAINDLGTGMAGTGKFFSGSTAEEASNISSEYVSDLLQSNISNLLSATQLGQSAASNLAGYQYGTGQSLSGVELSDYDTGIWSDLTAAGASLAGSYLGSQSAATPATTTVA